MSFRISEAMSVFFKDQDEVHEYVSEDVEDGYTCPFCNTCYEKDLQLAAELGKTLLERNKELEGALRNQQNLTEDQAQEIEYLRKQTAALREVNDSRMRIYEQLEVSIQELEHANHRLSTQAATDKKHVSSLESQVEKLELRLEETQRSLEEEQLKGIKQPERRRSSCSQEELTSLREEVASLRAACNKHQATVRALQATVEAVTQENVRLEEEVIVLQHKQEELTVQEDIGRGRVCCRCLRSQEDIYSLTGDEDSLSIVESIISNEHSLFRESVDDLADNPYRRLIEKYETLINLQREAASRASMRNDNGNQETKCMSLQEELKMSGEFYSFTREAEEDECEDEKRPTKATPDFSETETSSGFSDETINKGTQTDEGGVPGSFLCSITDGDDCKFSIYDEANQIESRFRKTPEYRKLFREIFDVLKRAAEAKDEGEQLPLLEDMTPIVENVPKVPPVTPAKEDLVPEMQFAADANAPVPEEKQAAPPKRDIMETLCTGLGGRKKKSRRQRSSDQQGGSRRRRWQPTDSGRSTPSRPQPPPTPPPKPLRSPDFAPPSSASQDVARLKRLEKSYAEVLRLGRQPLNRN